MLSPWHYGASPHPKSNLRQLILNLRIFATLFYEISRYNDDNIPPIHIPTDQYISLNYISLINFIGKIEKEEY